MAVPDALDPAYCDEMIAIRDHHSNDPNSPELEYLRDDIFDVHPGRHGPSPGKVWAQTSDGAGGRIRVGWIAIDDFEKYVEPSEHDDYYDGCFCCW